MKRSSSQQPGGNNIKEDGHERSPKKPKRDFIEKINRVAASLNKCIEEHENNRVETQSMIEEVCNVLREAVDNLEKRLIDDLQQNYTEEEARLQESSYSVKTLCYEDSDDMSDEEKDEVLTEAESALCYAQGYKLNHPNFEDVSKWANDTLNTEFNLDISQSLSDEIKRRTPRITGVEVSGPNEVHIDLEFLNEYEESAVKEIRQLSGIEYKVEVWNGEEGEDYEVRSEQILGPSHKAYIEWRHIGGSECKVRGKAVWKGLLGEECESEWSKWKSFTVPEEHKNSGVFKAGVVWKKLLERETYIICDKRTNIILYGGTKPYAILSDFVSGNEVLVFGQGGDTKWEKEMKIEEIPHTVENLLEDLKLFHTDKNICTRAIKEIADIIKLSEEVKECFVNLNGLDAFSNIMRNYIGDATLCIHGIYVFAMLSSYKVIGKLTFESGYVELIKDVINQHISNANICKNGLIAINNIIRNNLGIKILFRELEYIELIRDSIKQHINNPIICRSGLNVFSKIFSKNQMNKKFASELGCIELIRDAIRLHIDNIVVCRYGLSALDNIIFHDTHNKNIAGELGCIELIRDVIRQHINDTDTREKGFIVINNVTLENLPNQLKACEMGLIDFILGLMENHKDEQDINEWCCKCFVRLFSSQETHDKWCTEDVIKKVEGCQEKYKGSQLIKKCLICLKRTEDPRVTDAVSRGVCTKETTACNNEDCQRRKNNCFCLECVTPQKCYQCFDCEGCKACCEVCWKTKHAGHKGAEFFDLITYCERKMCSIGFKINNNNNINNNNVTIKID